MKILFSILAALVGLMLICTGLIFAGFRLEAILATVCFSIGLPVFVISILSLGE